MRGGVVFTYLIFAVVFGGIGFGIFFGIMLPEILNGQTEEIFPAFIVLFGFGGVGVGMGIAFFKTVACGIRSRRILATGAAGTGSFIDARVGATVNDTPYYKLTFSFKDSLGREHVVKTRSMYYKREVDALRLLGTFDVKYINNHAVVPRDVFRRSPAITRPGPQPSRSAHTIAAQTQHAQAIRFQRKTCTYCGGEVETDRARCCFCGSNKFEMLSILGAPAQAPAVNRVQQQPTASARPVLQQQQQNVRGTKAVVIVVVVFMVAPFVLGILMAIVGMFGAFDDQIDNNKTTPTVSYHKIGDTVRTDWFNMRIINTSAAVNAPATYNGTFPALKSGYRRCFFEVHLNNYRFDEDLDMNLSADFYVESYTRKKYRSINTGGGYDYYDEAGLGTQFTQQNDRRFFLGTFMITRGRSLQGVIVYDIPENEIHGTSYFVYEEYNFEDDTPTTVKHIYKFNI